MTSGVIDRAAGDIQPVTPFDVSSFLTPPETVETAPVAVANAAGINPFDFTGVGEEQSPAYASNRIAMAFDTSSVAVNAVNNAANAATTPVIDNAAVVADFLPETVETVPVDMNAPLEPPFGPITDPAQAATFNDFVMGMNNGTFELTDPKAIAAFDTLKTLASTDGATQSQVFEQLSTILHEEYGPFGGAGRENALEIGRHFAEVMRAGVEAGDQSAMDALRQFAWHCQQMGTNARVAGDLQTANTMLSSAFNDMSALSEHGSRGLKDAIADNLNEVAWEVRVLSRRLGLA